MQPPEAGTYDDARAKVEAALASICAEEGLLIGWALVGELDHPTEGRGIVVFESHGAPEWQTMGYLQYALDHIGEDEDAV